MPSVFQMLPLIARQNLGRQELQRIPEPSDVTDQTDNVLQYDRVMETKLAISYAIAIETIYRARPQPFGGRALDIACGPGHLSITMARELKLDTLVGVDLSAPMVEVAANNAASQGMDSLRFVQGDATRLEGFGDSEFDLTTMMDAAHHMPSLQLVTAALLQMDRVTKPDGLIVLMDLVRLRTKSLTERYVQLLAHDYVQRGLPNFLDDFRNSMYAAWTTQELASAVPATSGGRNWNLVVPRGLPFAQFLIGTPEDQGSLFFRRKRLWDNGRLPVTSDNRADYKIASITMSAASVRPLPATRSSASQES